MGPTIHKGVDMKISLLVPTRHRPKMLESFMSSVYKMTTHKKNVDIHFMVDEEDGSSVEYTKKIVAQYQNQIEMEVHYISRKNDILKFNLNEDYYNNIARKAKGDLLWVLADDLELTQPNWDEEVITEVTNFSIKYPDKIFCVGLLDNTKPPSHRHPKFPCFPMFTKEAREALGWILHPGIKTWGADYVNYCIFEPLNRLLKLYNKNYLHHNSFHTKTTGVDTTNEWIGQVFNQNKMIGGMNGMPYTDTLIDRDCPIIRNELKEKIASHYGKTAREMF